MSVTLSPLHIDCDFDSGNIQVLDASNPAQVRLAIRPDTHSDHYQWFHFRVSGLTPGQVHRFSLDNASGAATTPLPVTTSNAGSGYPASSMAARFRSSSRLSSHRSGSPTSNLTRALATTS